MRIARRTKSFGEKRPARHKASNRWRRFGFMVRNDWTRVNIRRAVPGNWPFARVAESEGRSAQLFAGALILIAGKVLVQKLQAMGYHPDRGAFGAVEGHSMGIEAGHQQPRCGMH